MNDINLPPLPNRWSYDDNGGEVFAADQMRAYAAAALAQQSDVPEGFREQLLGVCDAVLNPHALDPWGFAQQVANEALDWLEAAAPTPKEDSHD